MLTFPLKLVLPTPDEPMTTNFTVFTVESVTVIVEGQRSTSVFTFGGQAMLSDFGV